MPDWHQLDGFQLFSGLASVCAGPIMLGMGAPAGWAFLIMGAGILVVLAQSAIVAEITFDQPAATTVLLALVGVTFVGIAVIYLTRAANDLPTVFPGYDSTSENFRVIPGLVALAAGIVCLGRAITNVHPTRHPSR
jgi:hypothetical protein